MTSFQRYPLPTWIGILVGLAVSVVGFWAWQIRPVDGYGLDNVELVPVLVSGVVGLVVGVVSGWLVWYVLPLLCGWVVAMSPGAWAAHAELAGLFSLGAQEDQTGRRDRQPIQVARFTALPHIKKGALWIPIKTTSGGINHSNADDLAQNLARVMQLSTARVDWGNVQRNRGYVWFVLSARDWTV